MKHDKFPRLSSLPSFLSSSFFPPLSLFHSLVRFNLFLPFLSHTTMRITYSTKGTNSKTHCDRKACVIEEFFNKTFFMNSCHARNSVFLTFGMQHLWTNMKESEYYCCWPVSFSMLLGTIDNNLRKKHTIS